jgi:hypothetical protein
MLSLVAVLILISGCMTKRQGASHMDPFDTVRVDQMVGNNVSVAPFQRTILCLNARRETRKADAITNQNIVIVTNIALSTVTNQTVTVVTNQTRTMATNQVVTFPPPPPPPSTNEPAPPETNQVVTLAQPVNSNTTNNSVTSGSNLSFSKANNQTVATASHQTLFSQQITVTTNNLSITAADNQAISAETNKVITTVTNVTLSVVTNVVVTETNLLLRDYYLYTELTPPPDFVLQSGESLVLLIDGVRHGFAPATSQTAFVTRKGFSSILYRVPPDVLVDIANAREVKIRLKGVNTVVERNMSASSKHNLKKFLLKYFVPQTDTPVAALADFLPPSLASQSAR